MAKCQFFNKVFGQCAALLPAIPCSAFGCRAAAGDRRNCSAPSRPAQGRLFRLTISAKTFIFKALRAHCGIPPGRTDPVLSILYII